MKLISLFVVLALAATPAFAGKRYVPACVPSPSQDAPPCPVKDEPALVSTMVPESAAETTDAATLEAVKPGAAKALVNTAKPAVVHKKPVPKKAARQKVEAK